MKCRFCGAEIKPEKKKGAKIRRRDGKSIYIVQKGDTLWSICNGQDDVIKRVAKKNGLATPYGPIFPGQELEL